MSIQLKRSLTSNLNTNHILKQGQLGIEMPSSTNSASNPFKMKIGDGTSTYSSLPYFGSSSSNYIYTENMICQASTVNFATNTLSPLTNTVEQIWQIPNTRPYYIFQWDIFKTNVDSGSYQKITTRRYYSIVKPDGTSLANGNYSSSVFILNWSDYSSSYKTSKLKKFLVALGAHMKIGSQEIMFEREFIIEVPDAL